MAGLSAVPMACWELKMTEEVFGITTTDPMGFAVQVGENRWIVLEGSMSSVDGLCHKVEFPGFMTRSGASFGITADFHICEKGWRENGVERGNIARMTMVNGVLQAVETVARGIELIK
jgi:hypothetical protein